MRTTTRRPATTLIRTVDGVEWPLPGQWEIRPGHPLDVRRVRLLHRRRDLVSTYRGELVVADPGLGSTLHLAIGAAPGLRLVGIDVRATITAADELGSWQFAGTARAGDDLFHVDGVATYHGVFRAGARANAWLDLDVVLSETLRK